MGWKPVRVLSPPLRTSLSFSAGKNLDGEIALVPLAGVMRG
jgi:hypothetical protein